MPFFLALIVYFGRGVFRSAIRSLRRLDSANINFIMLIAVVGAFYLRESVLFVM